MSNLRAVARREKRAGRLRPAALLALPLLALPLLTRAQDLQILQHGFEARELLWAPGAADAAYREIAHRLTEETAHGGHRSESIELEARQGSFIHYTNGIGRAPVSEELTASLWVKANRQGVQLLARLVLPHERDPRNLGRPLTTLLRGETYQTAGRWQRIELRNPLRLVREQQQLLRAELKRDVTVADAYIDQLILNVYAGPGLTRIWTDDLEVGPVLSGRKEERGRMNKAGGGRDPGSSFLLPPSSLRSRAAEVRLDQERLLVSGRKFFLRGIRHSGTPLKTLRDAGFNAIWFDETADDRTVEQAVNLGFWLVPMLSAADPVVPAGPGPVEGQLTGSQLVGRRMARFLQQDAVLCWDLGGGLGAEQYTSVTRTAQAVRAVDPLRPVAADVWDGFQRYSRAIDQVMLGVHRWPLMTGLELAQYREWLSQRRRLAQPGTFAWTWVQTHLPEWFSALAYDRPAALGFQEPVGPQPEQIRLLAYTALAAGYRGLGFWSDRFLADSHAGRDRLLQMALLNLEFQLLEPLLVSAQSPLWVNTSLPQVKAAVMRTDHGVLCLPIWVGPGSQVVPGQAAAASLTVVVPQVPAATQAWLVSPGEVRTLRSERVVGGTRITIPEFSLTAAVVFTNDLSPTGQVVRFQDQCRGLSPLAAQWAHDLAQEELAKVSRVHQELEQVGRGLPDGPALLEDARRRVQLCASHRRGGDSAGAYAEAQRALRPLRILMRAHWEAATKELTTPVASPYAVSYFTLPRHWRFREEYSRARPAANVLPEGDFELSPTQTSMQWRVQEERTLDEVTRSARRVAEEPQQGRQALLLEIRPNDPKTPPAVLERTFLAVHSPAVRLAPGTLVRISGWVRIPEPIRASADGALLYDSAGGEPLAVRLVGAVPKWRQFTLYRRVPASGRIQVTLALTGLGKAYFDDVRVEPLVPPEGMARRLKDR